MASATDRKLLNAVRNATKALKSAARWATSSRPVKVDDDFVYETYLYVQLLLLAKANFDVGFVPGVGPDAYSFPRKPANKAGRPKFHIQQGGKLKWQVCAGTKVFDVHGDDRAPDVSLQEGSAGDRPTGADVIAIWDAKYRKRGGRLTSHEFSEFARWLDLLGLRGKEHPAKLRGFGKLEANALVTNGAHSTECDAECKRTGVCEVASFYPNCVCVRRPV